MGQGSSVSKLEDRYHVQKVKLGRGNFGTVWRAVDKESDAIVAVKQLDKSAIARRGMKRQDVEREIAMMKSCIHEHIIRLFEIFEDKNSIYLALEYCDGGDFGDKVKERGKTIQEDEAGSWMLQVLSAIAALHSKGICHRDIKPDNFMLTGAGNTLKLADFGIAVPVQRGKLLVDKCGTPAFMAPEQHNLPRKSKGYSFPVDLWAAGVLMYMLMENHHPFINEKGKMEDAKLMAGQLIFSVDQSVSFFSALSFSSSAQEEDRFSHMARQFCRRLVCPNPATRFTAKAALHEPWLVGHNRNAATKYSEAQRGVTPAVPLPEHQVVLASSTPPSSLLPPPSTVGISNGTLATYSEPQKETLPLDDIRVNISDSAMVTQADHELNASAGKDSPRIAPASFASLTDRPGDTAPDPEASLENDDAWEQFKRFSFAFLSEASLEKHDALNHDALQEALRLRDADLKKSREQIIMLEQKLYEQDCLWTRVQSKVQDRDPDNDASLPQYESQVVHFDNETRISQYESQVVQLTNEVQRLKAALSREAQERRDLETQATKLKASCDKAQHQIQQLEAAAQNSESAGCCKRRRRKRSKGTVTVMESSPSEDSQVDQITSL